VDFGSASYAREELIALSGQSEATRRVLRRGVEVVFWQSCEALFFIVCKCTGQERGLVS
jgi:hypothetical protein